MVEKPGAASEALRKALRQAEAAVRLEPTSAAIRLTLAYAQLRQGQNEEAHATFLACVRRRQGYGEQEQERQNQGRDVGLLFASPWSLPFTRAFTLHPADAAGLALACHHLGRPEEARRWLTAGQARLAELAERDRKDAELLLAEAAALVRP